MKREIAILLALAMIFALCACGTVQKMEPTPSPTPTPIPDYKNSSTVMKAAQKCFDLNGEYCMILYCPDRTVTSVSLYSIKDKVINFDNDDYTLVTFKGLFWGVDSHGNSCGKFNFNFNFKYTKDGGTGWGIDFN